MASDLDLGHVGPGELPRVLRLTAVRVRSRATPVAAAVLAAAACLGAGPLPDPGASAVRLVGAEQRRADPEPAVPREPRPAAITVPGAASGVPVVAAGTLAVPVLAVAVLAAPVPAPALPPPVVAAVPAPVPPRISELTRSGIPQAALTAYRSAAASIGVADPGCRLPWSLLAGIGRVETNHGQFGGRRPTEDGAVLPPILGVPLDGRPGTRVILDTDGGVLDGDLVHDRAVGPMQFIPGTWARWGADGDANGTADPHDLDDAALAAARYLCAGDRDVSTPEGRAAAVLSYNHSQAYVDLVTTLADAYADLTALTGPPPLVVPVPTGPVGLPEHPASISPPTPDAPAPTDPPPTTPPAPSPTDTPVTPPAPPTDGPTTPPTNGPTTPPADGPTTPPADGPTAPPTDPSGSPTAP